LKTGVRQVKFVVFIDDDDHDDYDDDDDNNKLSQCRFEDNI